MARVKQPKEEDPNKLKRERAGRYVTPDGRFAVEGNATGSWYIVDGERENELGLPLMQGPFATLDEAREQVVGLRNGEAEAAKAAGDTDAGKGPDKASTRPAEGEEDAPASRPRLRSMQGGKAEPTPGASAGADDKDAEPVPSPTDKPTRREPKSARPARRSAEQPAPAEPEAPREPTWLERLPSDRQAEARRLLAVLERLGIDDPALVRREIEANLPEVARVLLAHRIQREALEIWREPESVGREVATVPKDVRRHLRSIVEPTLEAAERVLAGKGSAPDVASFAWLVAVRTVSAVFDVIDAEGHETRVSGEPGWRLVELDGRREPTNRTITLDQSDLLEPTDNGA